MQVPDSFVPDVTQSPLGANPMQAQSVQPMRNAAPEQQEQMGAAVQHLGQETNDIGERIQNQMDTAMAKQAETGFLQTAMTIANGDGKNPGYLNTRGQDAISGYQDAAKALADAKQTAMDGLGSDFQKTMFNRVASQHLISFGREMADHRFQQLTQYTGEAAINRANTYATNAANAYATYGQTDANGHATGDFFKNLKIAEQETLDAAHIAKGAPAGSDVANAALLALHTQVGTATLSQMMDARAPYSKVQAVYADMKTNGFLDLRAMDTMGKMVKTYSEQEMTRTAVNQNLSDAQRAATGQPTSSAGTPDYQFAIKGATITANSYDPEKGSVQVNIPQGSSIQAPADGKVTQAGRDADGNFALKIEHADGSVTAFTGLQASNVKVGDAVERGENVATSGAVDKTPAVLWSLTGKDGQKVDPTKAGLAPVDLTRITDEKVLGQALEGVRKQITDPVLQQQATSEMESIVRHNQQMQNAAQRQTMQQATDAFYSGGEKWRSIPPTLFNQLSPEAQQKFKDLTNVPGGPAIDGAIDTRARFIEDPSTMTVDAVKAIRPQVTPATYLSLLQKATDLQNNPARVQEASGVNERIKYFANQAGLKSPDDKGFGDSDKQNYTVLVYKVTNDIDHLKAQNNGKATPEQVDKVIQQELIQRTLTTPRSAWNPVALFAPNATAKKFNFQMPDGATHVAPGSDGKMHYTDGKNDLGVVK